MEWAGQPQSADIVLHAAMATSDTPRWISIGALIVAFISAVVSWVTYASTHEIRSLDKATKRLDLARTDQSLQAEHIEDVEDEFEALTAQVWSVYTEIQHLADLRERATVDVTRPVRLERSAFQLQPRLWRDYQGHEQELRSQLNALARTTEELKELLRSIRDDVWNVSTLDVVRVVRHVRAGCDRFGADMDIRLTEASQIVTAEYKTLQDTIAAMRGEAPRGTSTAGRE